VDRTAEVHPTAVIEGSVVGPGARVGAHAVVRFSVIGENARLHDGAKVEFSTVGRGSWLMHDLVLFRCHVEDEVFLIHGPYQFSSFHTRSAAFATILMDWLPHGGPFKVLTPSGPKEYRGRFLGSVYRAGARTLGGTLLAPGRIVPEDTWLAGDPSQVHRRLDDGMPRGTPLPPDHPLSKGRHV
jgi:NDP-sugar pyrophosphorylase family protein